MENNLSSEIYFANYSVVFNFEKNFDGSFKRKWMKNNWHQAFYYSAAYVILVFVGQAIMRTRQPFQLRKLLCLWNICLCLFSTVGALRTLPELIHIVRKFGFTQSVCNPSYLDDSQVTSFWTWLFVMSKLPEFLDTAFIVLRKQKLIFLHWYHHAVTYLFAWYNYAHQVAPCRWFITINFSVHAVMYGYFALRAMKIKVFRSFAMMITLSQIIQMLIGCWVIYWSYKMYLKGNECTVTEGTTRAGFIMYISYFILFSKFFYDSYFSNHR